MNYLIVAITSFVLGCLFAKFYENGLDYYLVKSIKNLFNKTPDESKDLLSALSKEEK